jgi:hypothetical protein
MLAMPALVLRTVYGLLYEFASDSLFSTWSPLFGSAVAFSLMALLPEYIVLVIYVYLGFHRIRSCSQQQPDANTEVCERRRMRIPKDANTEGYEHRRNAKGQCGRIVRARS